MKDKCFIYYGNPCTSYLTDSEIQGFEDATLALLSPWRQAVVECPLASDPAKCSPPRFGCVRVAGARMARAVIQFYTEASEATLAMDRDFFRRRSPLPPKAVGAYVDPEHGFRHISDPEQVVQRVWEHARAVLDLQPGERVRRQVGRYTPPASHVPPVLLRHAERGVRRAQPGKVARPAVARPPWSAPQPAGQ
jgi:hypothetical protein